MAGEADDHAMQQELLGMGFSQEVAAAALSATGSKSTLHAAEWILNHHSTTAATTTTFPPSSSPSSVQHSLDRYFPSKQQQQRTSHSSLNTNTLPAPPPPPVESAATVTSNKRPKKSAPTAGVAEPLSERMRPHTVDDVVGQEHLLGPNSILRSSLSRDRLPSLIFWGPPGTGKTSIARAISASSNTTAAASYRFVSLSAVTSGVKDVRDVVDEARKLSKWKKRTVLFVDEVHRFNRAQLDSFLPAIEDGSIVFMGATTENPSFHLTTPLLSRCRVLALHSLEPTHIATLLRRAVEDEERGLALSAGRCIDADQEAVEFLSLHCDGDARVALNALEVAATLVANRTPGYDGGGCRISANIAIDDVKEALQCKHLAYDRQGDEHYNLISALHKSMRGSDPDAAIYWLARMLEGGEQPLYIARRLVRFASEDIGLADPSAMNQAVACYQACHFLGMPECDVNLAQCVAYLALAPKSVAVYKAMGAAKDVVKQSRGGNEGVPLHMRNAPTKLMKEFGYGKDYIYPPDHPDAPPQSFLPSSLQGIKFLEWPAPPKNF